MNKTTEEKNKISADLPKHTFLLMKTSYRRLENVFRLRLPDVLIKTNIFVLLIRLQKTCSRRLQDVLIKTNIIVLVIHLQDVFNTFRSYLQDVLQRCLQDVFKTYYHSKLFLLTRFQDVFETYSKRFEKYCKDGYL